MQSKNEIGFSMQQSFNIPYGFSNTFIRKIGKSFFISMINFEKVCSKEKQVLRPYSSSVK